MKSNVVKKPVVERVAELAMRLGGRHLADYGSTRNRHDFTQRQLMRADAEWVHDQCRLDWGAESVIKPAKQRADGTRSGFWRSRMSEKYLARKGYGARWAVESFFSALKRTMGSTLSSLQSSSHCSSAAAPLARAARTSNCPNSGAICGQSPRSIFSGTNFRGLCAGNFPNGNKFMRE